MAQRVSFVAFALSVLFVAGCDSGDSHSLDTVEGLSADAVPVDAVPVDAEPDPLACERTDDIDPFTETSVPVPFALMSEEVQRNPFRCLRFIDERDSMPQRETMKVVDIRRGVSDNPVADGRLHMPLHAIKTKAFLREKSLAIISDGKRFAVLEKECKSIKASGVADVFAVLPAPRQPGEAIQYSLSGLPGIKPQEFVAERASGIWHIVDLTGEGTSGSVLNRKTEAPSKAQSGGTRQEFVAGLERTLIVMDDDRLPTGDELISMRPGRGQLFVLEGGMEGLRRFQGEAAAMARAQSRPRISELGCRG